MLEFLATQFKQTPSQNLFTTFGLAHIIYVCIIAVLVFFAAYLLDKKTRADKQRAVKILANAAFTVYVLDLAASLIFYKTDINLHKLPFSICALFAVLIPLAQFSLSFRFMKKVVINLSVVVSFLWFVFPVNLDGSEKAFSYAAIQAFLYHGIIFAWGLLNLVLGEVGISIRKIWKDLLGVIFVVFWLNIGGLLFGGVVQLLNKDNIRLARYSEGISFLIFFVIFAACLVLYAVFYIVRRLTRNKRHKNGHRRRVMQQHIPINSAKDISLKREDL